MDEYRRYLADLILTQDKVITYRYLSRALGVQVNIAKQMLYEFHKSQNGRKPGSIHATYLIYGVKSSSESHNHVRDDGDVEMTSSMPEVESVAGQIPVYTLALVSEEKLSSALDEFEQVSSIHVYSIGPHPMNDMQLLSDTAQQVFSLATSADPSDQRKSYGAISNASVQRRDRKGVVPKPMVAASVSVASKKPENKAVSSAPMKEEPKAQQAAPAKTAPFSSAAADKKAPPPLKRGGSGIMQAFAKAATKPKKQEAASQSAVVSKTEAESSGGALSDDGEDDSEHMPTPKQPNTAEGGRISKKEREEALRRMMEEDDDDDMRKEEEDDDDGLQEEKEDTPMEDSVEEPIDLIAKKEEPAEVVSTSSGDGRRRGKRRVMRKKQIMDDQGYLVTIQEQAWESFSEDDAPAPSAKAAKAAAPASASSSQTAAKPKKAGSKGQGNIMSFFSKK